MSSVRSLSDRVRGLDLVRLDQLVGAALCVEIELQVWLGASIPDRVFVTLVAALLALGVAVRRRWPLSAVSVVLAFMTVRMLFGVGGNASYAGGVQIGVILLFYGLGAFAPARRSLWMLAVAVVITSLNSLTKVGGGVGAVFPMEAFAVLLPYALGRAIRTRAARELASRDAAERLDAALLTSARTAAYDERSRIARELHDVIAHSVSVMVIQAGGARLVLDTDVDRAEASLRAVEQAGNEALAEMRRLLGLLGEDEPRALAPQPGLNDLPALIAGARTAGLDTTLWTDGDACPVSPALDLCAYRVVQEALTNVGRHAQATKAVVSISERDGMVRASVTDDGRGLGEESRLGPRGDGLEGGFGTSGMRERAELVGGELELLPAPQHGTVVRLTVPLAGRPVRSDHVAGA